MGGPEGSSDALLPLRHGRRPTLFGKMVQGRARVLPLHPRAESQNARVQYGRHQRGRE